MSDVTAPPFCDLEWQSSGGGEFVALRTPLYEAAVSCAHQEMRSVGFELDRANVHLNLSGCVDLERLAKKLAVWTGAAERALAFARKRDDALRPLTGETIAPVQAGLISMLAENAWALGTRIDLAEEFASADALSRKQYLWALDILSTARIAVESVDARLSTEAGAAALERAYDEAVRTDLLAACRELTALDTDRCREANNMGWSAISSAAGHRLAGTASLTVLQAAHPLGLVYPHRRQLSEALRDRLFGSTPEAPSGP